MIIQHRAEIVMDEYRKIVGCTDDKILRTMEETERQYLFDFLYYHRPLMDSYLELGVNCGASFFVMSQFTKRNGKMVGVDLARGRSGQNEMRGAALRMIHTYADVMLFQGSTAERVEDVRPFAPFDVCLIDADHSYEAVKRDYENYGPMVRSGGLVIFHDTFAESMGVKRLWSEIRRSFDWSMEFGKNQGVGIGVKK